MKHFRITTEPSNLDVAIDVALESLSKEKPDTDEYTKILDQIVRLNKLKEKPSSSRVSPDALIAVFGNLAGIVLIINHERVNVITTKALGFVMKSKSI